MTLDVVPDDAAREKTAPRDAMPGLLAALHRRALRQRALPARAFLPTMSSRGTLLLPAPRLRAQRQAVLNRRAVLYRAALPPIVPRSLALARRAVRMRRRVNATSTWVRRLSAEGRDPSRLLQRALRL